MHCWVPGLPDCAGVARQASPVSRLSRAPLGARESRDPERHYWYGTRIKGHLGFGCRQIGAELESESRSIGVALQHGRTLAHDGLHDALAFLIAHCPCRQHSCRRAPSCSIAGRVRRPRNVWCAISSLTGLRGSRRPGAAPQAGPRLQSCTADPRWRPGGAPRRGAAPERTGFHRRSAMWLPPACRPSPAPAASALPPLACQERTAVLAGRRQRRTALRHGEAGRWHCPRASRCPVPQHAQRQAYPD